MSLQQLVGVAVILFCVMSAYLFLHHESAISSSSFSSFSNEKFSVSGPLHRKREEFVRSPSSRASRGSQKEVVVDLPPEEEEEEGGGQPSKKKKSSFPEGGGGEEKVDMKEQQRQQRRKEVSSSSSSAEQLTDAKEEVKAAAAAEESEGEGEGVEKRGLLQCDGKYVDSEVIYWKIVPGDNEYESPITPHHDLHHDRYITYEYDAGGWNNIRMALEVVMVFAHAMGRTLVSPPRQNLYLVDKKYKDKNGRMRSGMGFEDFFDLDLVKSHKGYHIITSEEFLEKEGVTGGLHGELPPKKNTKLGGRELNQYFRRVADQKPAWTGKFLAMPDAKMDMKSFNLSQIDLLPQEVRERMKRFGGERTPVFYDHTLQNAHHIHFQNEPNSRLLQHHYAFNFFADKEMQSFYRRFVRDYLRYKDEIQCSGHEIVKMVRADAIEHNRKMNNPGRDGSSTPDDSYYALHVRRGDFQYKDVKISAEQIVKNLVVDGEAVIPRGALVYLSTDDPKGVCKNCLVQRISCDKYEKGKKPPGCPEDPSWKAFETAGWTVRFLDDYVSKGAIPNANPNTFGMIESIVCSRAEIFAGTFYSSFTGYIHRLRGYHGIGEQSYYHSNGRVEAMRMKKSVGHGFSREWRAGWTDDEGGLI